MSGELLRFRSADEFKDYLREFVDLAQWGVGGAKTPTDLWKELREGDSGLVREENGLLRLTWPIFINVLYDNLNVAYEAYETKSKKGKFRNLPGTFAEKRHSSESVESAIRRTYQEEINSSLPQSGLSLRNSQLSFQNEWEENTGARSYPGLLTRSVNTLYALQLAPDQGIPKPFTLVEDNGVSEFDWKTQ